MERRIAICLILLLCLSSQAATNKKSNKLVKIKHSIENIKTEISKDQKLRISLQKKLKQTELAAIKIQNKLETTANALDQQTTQQQTIQAEIQKYQQIINQQKNIIAKEVQAAYLLGPPPLLKLLLGNEDFNTANRLRMYYFYLAQHQANSIKNLHRNILLLENFGAKSKKHTQTLKGLQQQQLKQQLQLKQVQQTRKSIIEELNKRIETKHQQLTYSKRIFEQTMANINQHHQAIESNNFAHLKGKLSWPTSGHILDIFGTKISHSELTWNGILISAPENQPVRAIAPGRVVFADWLPEYGLILIIDHGDGYMSLYGRNHRLYKKNGDIVNSGEMIADVGKSGGYSRSSLYFAIRHNAKPLNPVKWCQ